MSGFIRTLTAALGAALGLILVFPVILATGGFMALAAATRAVHRWMAPPHEDAERLIYRFDPAVGWRPKPGVDARYKSIGGDICRIRTDDEGWVGATSLDSSDVVVFGDSFASAYGIDSEKAFTELATDLRVKPIGAPGYNMVQSVLLMRQLRARIRRKVVIWFICLENDLYDNLRPNKPDGYRSPFVRRPGGGTGEWEIVTEHLAPTPWTASSDAAPYYPILARLCTPCEISARTYSAAEYLVREARDICRSVDCAMVVATVPNKNQLSPEGLRFLESHLSHPRALSEFDVDRPDREFARICRTLGVPFRAGKAVLSHRDYKKYDTHWTPAGHRRVAAWLTELVAAAGDETAPEVIPDIPTPDARGPATEERRGVVGGSS